jgi:predicted transcriptional regulator
MSQEGSLSLADELVYKKLFIESINRGLADVEDGKVYNTAAVKEELQKRRAVT